ncbi:MAG TPA: CHAT domain-containing protein, partial [Allocoleopsis sp.]
EAAALGSLGDTYRLRGNYEAAIEQLQASLAIATDLNDPVYTMSIQNSLGNAYLSLAQVNYRQVMVYEQALSSSQTGVVYPEATALRTQAKDHDQRALLYLQQSLQTAETTDDAEMQVRILLSLIPVYYRSGATAEAEAALEQAKSTWAGMKNSQEKVFFALDLAQFIQTPPVAEVPISRWQCSIAETNPIATPLIEQAVSIAEQINDPRSQSFALGELGHVYECNQNYDRALELTRQAQLIADQDLGSKDSLYLWQWQAGRIFKAQAGKQADKQADKQAEQLSAAIRAYEEAANTLKTVQDDIIVANREVRFDFRDTVEPIYRELVQLRLEQEQPSTLIPTPLNGTNNISQAMSTLDSLKLAELQNYFGNDCVLSALDQGTIHLTSIQDTNVAVLSTVMLGDRTAVILSFRDQTPQLQQKIEWIRDREGNYVDRATLIDQVNQYRQSLENVQDLAVGLRGYNRDYAAQLYDWVIRPFLPILQAQSIETLVFIQDGIFRSIPMAALYDGEQFLIEHYAL